MRPSTRAAYEDAVCACAAPAKPRPAPPRNPNENWRSMDFVVVVVAPVQILQILHGILTIPAGSLFFFLIYLFCEGSCKVLQGF